MKEYLKAQSKTNEIIVGNAISADELDRFSKSDFRWADNRNKSFQHRSVKKGEIYQFEFGKNYIPEMSYEHRGLVIGVKQKFLYVNEQVLSLTEDKTKLESEIKKLKSERDSMHNKLNRADVSILLRILTGK